MSARGYMAQDTIESEFIYLLRAVGEKTATFKDSNHDCFRTLTVFSPTGHVFKAETVVTTQEHTYLFRLG